MPRSKERRGSKVEKVLRGGKGGGVGHSEKAVLCEGIIYTAVFVLLFLSDVVDY